MAGQGPLWLLTQGPEGLLVFVLFAATIVVAIGLHEYGHALAADIQGDRLPRAMGRLTPNPIRHLDPLGTILLFLVGFGWGKPVEFRPAALSSKRFGAAFVALAGPLMNVLLALLGFVALRLFGDTAEWVNDFLTLFSEINVILAVFNLLPIPPLDGSRLLTIFLPPSKQNVIYFLDRFGFLILIGIVFLTPWVLFGPADFVLELIRGLVGV